MNTASYKPNRRVTKGRPLFIESLETRRMLATVQLAPIADNTLYESDTGAISNGVG